MKQRGSTLIFYVLVALAVMATLTAIVAGIYAKGREAGKASVQAAWDEANRKAREREAKAINTATVNLEAKNEKARTVYRTITKEVDKLVVEYRDRPCLDPLGLRLVNCAIRGQGPDTCKPDPALPGAGPAR